MPVLTSCANCGMTVPLPDVSMKFPACPSCGGVLEEVQEVPDAEILDANQEADPPSTSQESPASGFGWKEVPLPTPTPPRELTPSWNKLRQGLRVLDLTQRVFFVLWGLFVMSLVGILVYRVVDSIGGNRLLDGALNVGCGFLALTNLIAAVATFLCTGLHNGEVPNRWRLQAATIFHVLAGLLFIATIVAPMQRLVETPLATFILLTLSFAVTLIAEHQFQRFLDQAAKVLLEHQTASFARRGFVTVLVFLALYVVPLGMLVLFTNPDAGLLHIEIPQLLADLGAVGSGIVFGLASVGMSRQAQLPIRSLKEAIDRHQIVKVGQTLVETMNSN